MSSASRCGSAYSSVRSPLGTKLFSASFSELTPADAEAIRAYVIERSNWTKANLADTAAPMGR